MTIIDFIELHGTDQKLDPCVSIYRKEGKESFKIDMGCRWLETIEFLKYSEIDDRCTIKTKEGSFYRIIQASDTDFVKIFPQED